MEVAHATACVGAGVDMWDALADADWIQALTAIAAGAHLILAIACPCMHVEDANCSRANGIRILVASPAHN